MADTKKLVRAFLVLGTLTSLAVLSFSSFIQNTSQNQSNNNAGLIAQNGTSQYPQNAFTSPGGISRGLSPEARLLAEKELPAAKPSSNLTDDFAQNLAREVIISNPDGVQVGSDGQTYINPVDTDSIQAQLASDPELKNLKIPDWDKEAGTLASQILKSQTQSRDNYGAAFSQLASDIYDSAGSDSSNVSADDLPTMENAVGGVLKTALQTETPESFYNLQKSFIKLLVYEKNIIALGEQAEADPLKANLIYQAEETKYDSALRELEEEFQKASSLGLGAGSKPDSAAVIIQQLLGIRTAYAAGWPVVDIAKILQTSTDNVMKEIKSILLQTLKNVIMTIFQRSILTFIQNNGNARFIRNWAATLAGAYALGAGSAALKMSTGLCSSFGPAIMNQIMPAYGLNSAGMSYGVCSVEKFVLSNPDPNNVSTFWNVYALQTQPANSYMGSLFSTSQQISAAAQQAQNTEQAKAVANQGFKSGGKQAGQCSDPITPTYPYSPPGSCIAGEDCEADAINSITDIMNSESNYMVTQPTTCANGTCTAVLCPKSEVATGQFAEDIQNPAKAVSDMLNQAFGAPVKLTASANNIVGLLSTVINSFINQMMMGSGSLIGATQGTPSYGSTALPAEMPASSTLPLPSLPAVACSLSSQVVSSTQAAVLTAAGGDGTNYSWSAPGGTPATSTGQIFSVTYYDFIPTIHSVTVTSNNQSSTCTVSTQ